MGYERNHLREFNYPVAVRLNIILVENKRTTIDDDIDRGREMDDDDVRDWEKNLIKGSHIPGKVW